MNEVRGALVFLVVVVGSSGGAKSSPVRLGVVLRDEYDLLSTATAITRNLSRRSSGLDLMVGLTLIPSAVPKGAVCLDGSLPGYHLHPGFGSGNNSWLIQLEGGGWCNTIQNCVSRKNTRLGSSKYMEKALPFVGILSDKPDENPDLYNWNRVKLRYCDGASFSGEGHNETSQLYFRGKRIWLAGMEDLMAKGMHNADQALLSGQSAGALASMLRCDEFRQLFPATIRVKCLSDAGLFLDASQMLDAVDGFSKSKKNGVFINSCFAHVQTERKGMWFAYDSPMIGDKLQLLSAVLL
ncbi:hypothetical protein Sjap_007077 [Stephania japonica]|uniref:Pectin acetylesterase n=1 Tax=Stephania japonica TaxID=461633 RepID=A0AAP0PLQ1_9MAGN